MFYDYVLWYTIFVAVYCLFANVIGWIAKTDLCNFSNKQIMLGKVFIMETVTCNHQLLKIKALLLTFLRDFINLLLWLIRRFMSDLRYPWQLYNSVSTGISMKSKASQSNTSLISWCIVLQCICAVYFIFIQFVYFSFILVCNFLVNFCQIRSLVEYSLFSFYVSLCR